MKILLLRGCHYLLEHANGLLGCSCKRKKKKNSQYTFSIHTKPTASLFSVLLRTFCYWNQGAFRFLLNESSDRNLLLITNYASWNKKGDVLFYSVLKNSPHWPVECYIWEIHVYIWFRFQLKFPLLLRVFLDSCIILLLWQSTCTPT